MITRMQQRFVAEYLADPKRNGKEAAIRAGYSPKCAAVVACRHLQDEEVQKLIDRQLSGYLKKLDVDAEMVIQGILDAIEDARRAGQGAWQSGSILRGYELLGRYLGIFSDKVEVGLDQEIMQRLMQGRAYAAGLLKEKDPEEEEEPDDKEKPKPN